MTMRQTSSAHAPDLNGSTTLAVRLSPRPMREWPISSPVSRPIRSNGWKIVYPAVVSSLSTCFEGFHW